MDVNPISARRRRTGTRARVLAAAGLATLAVGVTRTAPAQTPAATLRPARPLELTAGRIVARGASPTPSFAAFETPRPTAVPAAAPQAGRSPGWLAGPSPIPPPSAVNTLPSLTPASASVPAVSPKKPQSFVGRMWGDAKEFVAGSPTPPPAPPRPTYPAATPMPAAQPALPTTGGVYAGPPAYRWYGWGGTTPGANPYAPTGHSPRGSATWYAQSGATPGAFPVPVMNPTRPEPGIEAPAYTGRGGSAAPGEPVVRPASGRWLPPTSPPAPERVAAPVQVFNPIPTAPYTPTDGANPGVTIPVPPPVLLPRANSNAGELVPIAQTTPSNGAVPAAAALQPADTGVVPTAALTPAAPPTQPPTPALTWQSARAEGASDVRFTAAGGERLIASNVRSIPAIAPAAKPADTDAARSAAPPWVTRGQQPPAPDEAGVDAAVRNACCGRAIVTEVRHTGPSSLLVRLSAPSHDDAQSAARAVSRLPQLRDHTVDFELTLSDR